MAYADARGKREPEVPNPIAPPAVGNRPADRELPTVEPDIQIQNEAPGYEIPDDVVTPEDLQEKEEEPAPAPIAPPEPEPEPEPEPQYTVPPEQQLELKQANVWEPHYTFDDETGEATVEEANPVQPSSQWTQDQVNSANNAKKKFFSTPTVIPVEAVPKTNPVDYTTPTETIVTPNLDFFAGRNADVTVGNKANTMGYLRAEEQTPIYEGAPIEDLKDAQRRNQDRLDRTLEATYGTTDVDPAVASQNLEQPFTMEDLQRGIDALTSLGGGNLFNGIEIPGSVREGAGDIANGLKQGGQWIPDETAGGGDSNAWNSFVNGLKFVADSMHTGLPEYNPDDMASGNPLINAVGVAGSVIPALYHEYSDGWQDNVQVPAENLLDQEAPELQPNPITQYSAENATDNEVEPQHADRTPWHWADDAPMTFTDEDGNVWSYNSAYGNYVRPINGIDRTTGKPTIESYAQYTGDQYKVYDTTPRTNSTGGNWNIIDAQEGYYSDADAIPRINEDGTMNDAMRELTYAMVDEDGNDLYTQFDPSGNPHYFQRKQKADGTYELVEYTQKVDHKYDPLSILTTFVNSSYDGTNNLYRGMEWMNDLTPEEQAGMKELLATLYKRGDEYFGLNRESGDRSDRPYEIADMTEDEYRHFAELFMKNMPALQVLMDKNVITSDDIAQFFFKDIKQNPENPKKNGNNNGSKNYGYRSYGGGRGGSGGYRGGGGGSSYMPSYTNPYSPRSSSGGGYTRGGGISSSSGGAEISRSAEPTQTNQKQNRIYNIMKNWSF